ncbi:MAG: Sir2 family NAD-dependent protein deacetylase [Alphaproteobacteria bacterium]|mgnify:CR=1 FL=1
MTALLPEAAIESLKRALEASKRAVVFTGAGISTESGIPDFRSPGGLWSQYRPIEFGEFLASAEARAEYWRRKIETDKVLLKAEPNRGHRAIAKLVRTGKISSVITQNIDGLHQSSGIEAAKVIELHGNTTYATCLDCGERYELAPIKQAFQADGTLPECTDCLGIIKPATIAFGQAMPEAAMRQAEMETLAADLFIAAGSSLVVYPAAGFPVLAKRNGARLVILNREATPLDEFADLVLRGEIGPILGTAANVN